MDIRQLQVFREIMKTGSMSEAARNLNRTQPAVSLALKNLEDELGVSLFDRDTRNLKPVPEAYYLLEEADGILNQMSQLQRTMKRLNIGAEGEVHLAVMPGAATVFFPEFLKQFVQGRPDIKLSMATRSSTQLRELVGSQGVDFGFGDYDEEQGATPQTTVTRVSANCFIALPIDHPLAQKTTLSTMDLNKLVMGRMQADHQFDIKFQAHLNRHGVNTSVQFRSQTGLPLISFVSAGLCCAVVDPLTVASARLMGKSSLLAFRQLDEPVQYDYAILIPKLRRLPALAHNLASDWKSHLLEQLEELDANPTFY